MQVSSRSTRLLRRSFDEDYLGNSQHDSPSKSVRLWKSTKQTAGLGTRLAGFSLLTLFGSHHWGFIPLVGGIGGFLVLSVLGYFTVRAIWRYMSSRHLLARYQLETLLDAFQGVLLDLKKAFESGTIDAMTYQHRVQRALELFDDEVRKHVIAVERLRGNIHTSGLQSDKVLHYLHSKRFLVVQ